MSRLSTHLLKNPGFKVIVSVIEPLIYRQALVGLLAMSLSCP